MRHSQFILMVQLACGSWKRQHYWHIHTFLACIAQGLHGQVEATKTHVGATNAPTRHRSQTVDNILRLVLNKIGRLLWSIKRTSRVFPLIYSSFCFSSSSILKLDTTISVIHCDCELDEIIHHIIQLL